MQIHVSRKSMRSANPRSLSEAQEAAQLLSGMDFAQCILSSCFKGLDTTIIKRRCRVVNLTPYDGWLEKACLQSRLTGGPEIISLSLSLDLTATHAEQVVAVKLLQECSTPAF